MTTFQRTPAALAFAAMFALSGCGERDEAASTSGTRSSPSATTTMPPASNPASAPAR